MSDDDFDIESLSAYLHLGAAQVARLAERGKIPTRRVQGHWRFSRPEIMRWLEDRIGASDGAELTEMESFLRPPTAASPDEPHSIVELLPSDAIALPLAAQTRASVIREMVEVAARTGLVWDAERLAEAVRAREELHTTALETGVALLHPRRPLPQILGGPLLAFGRTARGIPFGSPVLTDLFFLVCSLDDRGHLQTLARLSRLIAAPAFVGQLREAPDAAAVRGIIGQTEAELKS